MKKFSTALLTVGFLAAIQTIALAQSSVKSGSMKNDREILSALNAQFIQNYLNNDTVAHNKIVHKDFVCITSSGTVLDRRTYMMGWAQGYNKDVTPSFVMKDEYIRIFGDIALVRAVTKFTVIRDGKKEVGKTMYTDTYIKDNGRWQCIQAQLTGVKK
jgi:hypothetical protein